jgi:hypothetical protein
MDGFLWGYGGKYTYDRWDSHSAEIDPEAKTIRRRIGSALLLSQPALVEFARRLRQAGGTVVANNAVITRTIGAQPIIFDWEITEGPFVHLAPTPACLGNPAAINQETDVYVDVLNKLRWANLYFYYGEKLLTYRSAPARMYPITVQALHAGIIHGRERIVTTHSGVYGWHGDTDLHHVYLFDGRGHEIPSAAVTTIDTGGVRTEVQLGERHMAIVRRIPAAVAAAIPVNARCETYERDIFRLRLSGKVEARVTVRDGEFAIRPGMTYELDTGTDATTSLTALPEGTLTFATRLDGETVLTLQPAGNQR